MSNEMTSQNQITEGGILRPLLAFFFPILLGTFFQQLYNTADAVVVGNYVGTVALAAVGGSTGTLIGLFVNLFVGVASGSTVIIAQCYGARDFDGVRKTVHTSVAIAVAGGLIAMVITLLGAEPALRAMGTPADVIPDAALYLRIYALGMVPSFLYNIGSGILRAVGDTKRPLYFLIIACLTNIVLDVLFVVGFGMGVLGVATATVISQVVSCVLVMLMLMRSTSVFSVHRSEIGFTDYSTRRVLRVGLPAALQSNMFTIANIIIQSSINSFGTDTVAAWTAYGKVDGLFWMIMGALGISVTTFVGQNFGAQKFARVKKSIRVCLTMSLSTTIALSVLLLVFMEPLLRFFTGDETVIQIGQNFFWVLAPSYFTYVFIEILSGAIRGAGEAFQPMVITCFGVCGLRILWLTVVVSIWHSMEMVAMNYPVTWVIAAIVFVIYYCRMNWLRRCIKRSGFPMPEKL